MFSGAVTSTQFTHPGRDPCLNDTQPWGRQRECERKVETDLQRAAFTNQPSRQPWLEGFVSEAVFRIRQLSAEAEPKLIGPIWRKIFSNSISHLLVSFFLSVPPLVLHSSFKLSLFSFFFSSLSLRDSSHTLPVVSEPSVLAHILRSSLVLLRRHYFPAWLSINVAVWKWRPAPLLSKC